MQAAREGVFDLVPWICRHHGFLGREFTAPMCREREPGSGTLIGRFSSFPAGGVSDRRHDPRLSSFTFSVEDAPVECRISI
jgi:hypothetical protein